MGGAGQARHFYYGADEQAMSVKSKDFDDVYEVSGQSQMLRDLRNSNKGAPVPADKSMDSNSRSKQLTFGKDEEDDDDGLGSSQEMIENSSNSMVNMAISMDPLQANRVLGAIDQSALQKQKDAIEPYM